MQDAQDDGDELRSENACSVSNINVIHAGLEERSVAEMKKSTISDLENETEEQGWETKAGV